MKVLSNSGVSLAVGEFKELMDAAYGGSGFSFVDLAADRAGVHFAETAMDKNGGAVLLQSVMAANFGEKIFFPDSFFCIPYYPPEASKIMVAYMA